MGFEAPAYKLVWPAESMWHGLEVRLRGMSIGELEEISKLRAKVGTSASELEQVMPILDILGSALLSWNLESAGEPVGLSDFRKQDASMLLAIVTAWTGVVGEISPPSPPISSGGERSEEESMPMEIPSSSHPSLSTPN